MAEMQFERGIIMNIDNHCSDLYRQRDWKALHGALDNASPGRDSDERRQIGFWRANALSAEGRHDEAIDALRAIGSDCRCRTRVSKNIAENLRRLGRDMEAIEELKNAPLAEEWDCFRALVLDAKYVLAHLLASNGLEVYKAILDDIPDGYIHITDRGHRISKSDLVDLISGKKKSSI
ncbi:MAG: hypothetical protein AB7V61_06950 [Methylocystis sp.]|uniref:hypothetical protein n=1 Tax=Methylocystis sp. TaxID=1911079 RepID=UPI003D14E158